VLMIVGPDWMAHTVEFGHGKALYVWNMLQGVLLILQVSYVIAILLSLINIGSTIAFNIISSLGIGALLSSYIMSIGCVTLKRLRDETLLPSRFSLGRAGLPINIYSLLFLVLAFIMTFFPQVPNPDPAAMNWSIVVFGSVVVFSVLYFLVRGRHQYAGPVAYVKKDL
jgi:choline transport protein